MITPLKVINNYPSCFYVETYNKIHDCVICLENEKRVKEWINAITQNIVNC